MNKNLKNYIKLLRYDKNNNDNLSLNITKFPIFVKPEIIRDTILPIGKIKNI